MEDQSNNSRRRLAIIGAGVFFALVLLTRALPPMKAVDQIVEWDGSRQTEYKFFGVIPYSSLSHDPSIHVKQDYQSALAATGIRVPVGFKVDFCIRSFRLPGEDYYGRATIEGDPGQLDAFFLAQGFKMGYGNGSSFEMVMTSPNGLKRRLEITTLGSAKSKGMSRISLSLSFDVKPAKP